MLRINGQEANDHVILHVWIACLVRTQLRMRLIDDQCVNVWLGGRYVVVLDQVPKTNEHLPRICVVLRESLADGAPLVERLILWGVDFGAVLGPHPVVEGVKIVAILVEPCQQLIAL